MDREEIVDAQVVFDPQLDDRPVRWRELLALLLVVALSDVTVYRGEGFAGLAALFVGVALLLLFGAPVSSSLQTRRQTTSLWIVGGLIVLLATKMVWCGTELQIALGLGLLMAFALALSGTVPYVLDIVVFPARMMLGGLLGLASYTRSVRAPRWRIARVSWLSILLPLLTFVAFSVLFILANPDLLDSFGQRIEQILTAFREWLIDFGPEPPEIVFWLAVAWIAIGMLRPLLSRAPIDEMSTLAWGEKPGSVAPAPSPMYAACRNTLVTVIALFAVYLMFEFKTLWFREFPRGFYYSGYAHQGAAWLTVALALATAVLSLAFRGSILHDSRLRSLRRLTWLWSLENILLAIAVYHRLYIYIGFNGMTRMRIVGLLGISSVLVGFLLVLRKIARNHSFVWLLRRHLWTVALALYLYGVMPVDRFVVDYNVQRILGGDSAPSVQISVHPISSEGELLLEPLLQCDDVMVREGVRAYLAQRHEELERSAAARAEKGWTAFQCADQLLQARLRAITDQLAVYGDPQRRDATLKTFHKYAYQWF